MSPKIGAESTVSKIPAGLIWFIIDIIIVLSYMALNWRHPQFSDIFRQAKAWKLQNGTTQKRLPGSAWRHDAADSAAHDVNIHQHAMISMSSTVFCIAYGHVNVMYIPFYSIGILYDTKIQLCNQSIYNNNIHNVHIYIIYTCISMYSIICMIDVA